MLLQIAFHSAALEYDWVCGPSAYWASLYSQIQFFGVLLGTILFGTLSDTFGRRPAALIALVGGILISFCSGKTKTPYLAIMATLSNKCDSKENFGSVIVAIVLMYLREWTEGSVTNTEAITGCFWLIRFCSSSAAKTLLSVSSAQPHKRKNIHRHTRHALFWLQQQRHSLDFHEGRALQGF